MELTDKERRFIDKRTMLGKAWPIVGAVMLVLFVGLSVYLFVYVPGLVNPCSVLSDLKTNSIPPSSLTLRAVLLSLVFPLLIILCLALLASIHAMISMEKKYMLIIRRLLQN